MTAIFAVTFAMSAVLICKWTLSHYDDDGDDQLPHYTDQCMSCVPRYSISHYDDDIGYIRAITRGGNQHVSTNIVQRFFRVRPLFLVYKSRDARLGSGDRRILVQVKNGADGWRKSEGAHARDAAVNVQSANKLIQKRDRQCPFGITYTIRAIHHENHVNRTIHTCNDFIHVLLIFSVKNLVKVGEK